MLTPAAVRQGLVMSPERLMAEGLAGWLEQEGEDLTWVAAAGSEEALAALDRVATRLAVLDARDASWGDRVLRLARSAHPALPVVVITHGDPQQLVALVRLGARGWVSSSGDETALRPAISAVLSGRTWLPRSVLEALVDEHVNGVAVGDADRLLRLTSRERQVLECIAAGLTRTRAAVSLSISADTVRTHMHHVLSKLEVDSSYQAVAIALRAGVVSPPS